MLRPSKTESFLGMVFSHAFFSSPYLLVKVTEIMTVIHTLHISILTLREIILWYNYASSNADVVCGGHLPLQVNECKKLLFKARSPWSVPTDTQYCEFQDIQTFSL